MNNYTLCLVCGEIYKTDLLPKYQTACPKYDCYGDNALIELDEYMVYPIKILNEKAWNTIYCCSGHIIDEFNHGYIAFYIEDNKDLFNIEPPKYWKWNENCLQATEDFTDNLSKNLTIIENQIQSLLEWCKNLPCNPAFCD